jgi:hypothetical protein
MSLVATHDRLALIVAQVSDVALQIRVLGVDLCYGRLYVLREGDLLRGKLTLDLAVSEIVREKHGPCAKAQNYYHQYLKADDAPTKISCHCFILLCVALPGFD